MTKTHRELLNGSLDDLEYHFRHERTSELLCYRSQRGLLDIDNIEPSLFRQQFRFQKEDFNNLFSALKLPETVKSAQNVTVPGREALCITLRRLAYPNRWCDLETIFGRHSSVMSSVASEVIFYIVSEFSHLLEDCNNHDWLCPATLGEFANAIRNRGAALTNCWAFIDGTARPICRPKRNQRDYFSGHKRMHMLKYQSVMCPNGIVCQLDGPYPGRRHDAGILQSSGLYAKLEKLVGPHQFVIYGDPAYPLKPLLMKPYGGSSLTTTQLAFNTSMSRVRQAVELGFGKVISEFAFLDFKKNQKLLRQEVAHTYKAATILTNCHTCLYGSQVSQYFELRPPSLNEYLRPHH
ncbi:uncharacterized protein [Dermacentor albipictus]|uniref:uncharacterized protein n=1 Tax=Dermacentor albipictus TaxID=60249 RepID=UPI0031FC1E38